MEMIQMSELVGYQCPKCGHILKQHPGLKIKCPKCISSGKEYDITGVVITEGELYDLDTDVNGYAHIGDVIDFLRSKGVNIIGEA